MVFGESTPTHCSHDSHAEPDLIQFYNVPFSKNTNKLAFFTVELPEGGSFVFVEHARPGFTMRRWYNQDHHERMK